MVFFLSFHRSSTVTKVDDCRQQLFTKKGRSLDHIPPSQNALLQHAKQAAFQEGYVWEKCMKLRQNLPSPAQWSWEYQPAKDEWQPIWTTVPIAAEACLELVRCGCKKGCTAARCRCVKTGMNVPICVSVTGSAMPAANNNQL